MKKLLSTVVISVLLASVSVVSAKTIVIDQDFDDTLVRFERVHHLNDALDVYSLDENFVETAGDLTAPVTEYVRGRNLWVSERPYIDYDVEQGNVFATGTSTVDAVEGWTGWYGHQNIIYTLNEDVQWVDVNFKYKNDRVDRGNVVVIFEKVDDNGVRQWVKVARWETAGDVEGWQSLKVTKAEVLTLVEGQTFNRVQFCEWDIGTEGNSYFDDLTVTYEVPDPIVEPEPVFAVDTYERASIEIPASDTPEPVVVEVVPVVVEVVPVVKKKCNKNWKKRSFKCKQTKRHCKKYSWKKNWKKRSFECKQTKTHRSADVKRRYTDDDGNEVKFTSFTPGEKNKHRK